MHDLDQARVLAFRVLLELVGLSGSEVRDTSADQRVAKALELLYKSYISVFWPFFDGGDMTLAFQNLQNLDFLMGSMTLAFQNL